MQKEVKINPLNYSVITSLLVLVLAHADTSFAGETDSDTTLKEVHVGAARSSLPIEDSPRSIDVIDAKKIAERPGANIQSLLSELPGVEFARSGGLGGQVSMRGFRSNEGRTVLTIDGERFRGRSVLEYQLIDPNAIDRIEVVRGPVSALYGADAMNGVVNIVTRRAKVDVNKPFELSASVKAVDINSVNSMFGTRAELVGGGNGFDLLVGANFRTADDYRTPLGVAQNSGFDSRGIDFKGGYSPDANKRWEISGRYQRVEAERAGGQGGAPGYPLLMVEEKPLQERYLRVGYEAWKLDSVVDRVNASMYIRDLKSDIYNTNQKVTTKTVYSQTQVYSPTVIGGRLGGEKLLGDHLVSINSDFFHEDAAGSRQTSTTVNNSGTVTAYSAMAATARDATQTNVGISLGDDWRVTPRWNLSGVVRADWVNTKISQTPLSGEAAAVKAAFAKAGAERTDTPLTGNFGTVFKANDVFDLTANLSKSFRSPSGGDKTQTQVANNITTLPNPDLRPEKSTTVEIGTRWHGNGHSGQVALYQSCYTDLISLVSLSSTQSQRQNVGEADIRGVEVNGSAVISGPWSAKYAAAYTRGTNTTTNVPLAGISPLSGRFALRYEAGNQSYGEAVMRTYKGTTRIDTTQERRRSGYTIFDLYAGASLDRWFGAASKNWKASFGIENIFNKVARNSTVYEDINYAVSIGNPLVEPGRAFVMKLYSTL